MFYKNVKIHIKIYTKLLLHVSVKQRSSGSLLLCFADSYRRFQLTILIIITLAKHNNKLPEDGCRSNLV